MKKKQTPISKLSLRKNKPLTHIKSKIQWIILILLVLVIPFGIWSNLFAYEYYYIKCEGRPLEVTGKYYKAPGDEGYGIHPGSDYSRCLYEGPAGVQRDPSTKIGAAAVQRKVDEANRLKNLASEYKIYVPDGYEMSDITTSNLGDRMETTFTITTDSNRKYRVREMKKDSEFSYTNLCSKPAEGSWSGTVIGNDSKGREICRTDLSKYIKDYIVGINIENTAIMLQTPIDTDEVLNAEVTAIFSTFKVHSKSLGDTLR